MNDQPENISQDEDDFEFPGPFEYPPPVDKLLTYGDPREESIWPNYRELGLRKEHIPHLINMVQDETLHDALYTEDEDRELKVWAPVHAWRALGQLGALEAVDVLLDQFWRVEDGDEWVAEEMPTVFGLLGIQTIPKLKAYLEPGGMRGTEPRIIVIDCLLSIANVWPYVDAMCLEIFKQVLADYRKNYPMVNVGLIQGLLRCHDRTALPLMAEAANSEFVPPEFARDWRVIARNLVHQLREDDTMPEEVRQFMIQSLKTEVVQPVNKSRKRKKRK